MLDVNAGIPLADEPAILAADDPARAVAHRRAAVDRLVDRRGARGRARGLPGQGRCVNSVTGEEERLERVLPLVEKYGAAVVAISNDETGICEDPDVRFAVAKKIVERAADYGIPRAGRRRRPAGDADRRAWATAGRQVFALVRRLREELRVNTTCGASNVSFGLPQPPRHQRAPSCRWRSRAGMTSAITNPLHAEVQAGGAWPPTC